MSGTTNLVKKPLPVGVNSTVQLKKPSTQDIGLASHHFQPPPQPIPNNKPVYIKNNDPNLQPTLIDKSKQFQSVAEVERYDYPLFITHKIQAKLSCSLY